MSHTANHRGVTARRAVGAVAAAIVAAVSLSGCLYAQIPEASPSITREPDTAGVPDGLMPFYGQRIEWEPCGAGLDCADIVAPIDWDDPAAGDISLAIVRHQATDEYQGSLLVNPGGPGASGYDFVAQSLTFAVGTALIERFDVIGFDPRGVGRSTAVNCFDDDAQRDSFYYDIPSAPRGTEAWEAEIQAANKEYADRCAAKTGDLLPHVTTVNAARDMDLIRAVLGDTRLHYLGYSYGTFLGATYAELFPERAQGLVLDGAMDPSIPVLDVGATQALGFESALHAYLESCLASSGCPFRGTLDDALADFRALLASVERSPLPGGDGRMLGADTMVTGVITALYSESTWQYLSDALTAALQGDPSTMFFLADNYNGRRPDGGYLDNSMQAFDAYNCMDFPAVDDPAAEAASLRRIERGAPTFAPYWQGPDLCEVWPYPATGARAPIAASGSGPILVVGTTNDPATPYEWSASLAEQLASGVLITRVGEGHTGYNKGNSCVDDAVEGFLIEGIVPEDGLRCG